MHPAIAQHRSGICAICQRYRIIQLAEILVLDQFSRNVYRRTTPRPAPRLCARRAGLGASPRAGGKRARPQLGAGAAQVCLHALYAQRVSRHSRASGLAVFATGVCVLACGL
jgi:Bacterial protein of unknown function (DUF924)